MNRLLENRIFIGSSVLIITLFSISVFFNILWLPITLVGLLLIALAFLRPVQLFWLLIIAIPLSFEYSIAKYLGTDFPDEPLMLVTLASALMVWTYYYQKNLVLLVRHPLFYLLLLQFIWSIVSAYHSQEPILSAKICSFQNLVYCSIRDGTSVDFNSKVQMENTRLLHSTSDCFNLLLYMIRHSQYGFSFVSINEAASPIFRNHVTYAASLSIGFSVLLGIMYMYPSKRKNPLYITMILIVLLAIYFSYTRGTWLSILTSILVLFSYYINYFNPFLLHYWLRWCC